jgi:transcriptional regulator with XRE-family HTH domain
MHGDISFVPEVLPIAPRPIAGELISSWLLRVSFANGLTLAELVQKEEELARMLGVSRQLVANWLAGRKTPTGDH